MEGLEAIEQEEVDLASLLNSEVVVEAQKLVVQNGDFLEFPNVSEMQVEGELIRLHSFHVIFLFSDSAWAAVRASLELGWLASVRIGSPMTACFYLVTAAAFGPDLKGSVWIADTACKASALKTSKPPAVLTVLTVAVDAATRTFLLPLGALRCLCPVRAS